ncbi:MAG: 4Fe-4S binding protein [Acidiferrobacterales bacterium]|nr:4Fe-4S binding protein [Acidiferrobacterales bacterium]
MSNYLDTIALTLTASSESGTAREQVLSAIPWQPTPTTNVSYTAANRVLIIGDGEEVEKIESTLPAPVECFSMDPAEDRFSGAKLEGYLGRFSLHLPTGSHSQAESDQTNIGVMLGVANGLFDQVIDLGESAMIGAAIKPPGYYFPGGDTEKLDAALAQIPELIGEFEKPKFFDYNPDICAHGRSGLQGCRRCIEACPTDAIISIGEQIEVNPHLCQGGGSCTASCPSGAISYRYPQAEEQIEFLRQMTRDFRERRESRGISLLIYDIEHGEKIIRGGEGLPEHVLPLEVEEIGSVGLDLMSAALAYGANRLHILVPETVSEQIAASVGRDATLLHDLLRTLNLDGYELNIISDVVELSSDKEDESRLETVATYAGIGSKRALIRNALEFLYAQSVAKPEYAKLPENSIFGEVSLDYDACTLCMACVSVCPASALEAGGESPALKFIEANCLQCGLCATACPESALTLAPRFLFDGIAAKKVRALKEEEPFRCIQCNKPFATNAMIDRMTEKLSGHWMFEKPEALNRLRMCEDCRVADMFNESA